MPPMWAEQHAHYMEMRAVTIRYLKMLEDEANRRRRAATDRPGVLDAERRAGIRARVVLT